MKIKIGLGFVITLFLCAPLFADSITGFDNATATVFWTGTFTLGAMTSPNVFDVTAFNVNPPTCSACTPTSPAWAVTSLQFDSLTGDLFGTTNADYSGLGIGVHLLTLTFTDGNNTSDPWTDFNAKTGSTKTGTFSYCIGQGCSIPRTPEPSASLLVVCALMPLFGWMRSRYQNR